MSMLLYYRPGTCALGPHIVLHWLKADFQLELADTKSPEFPKINPMLAVPALRTIDVGVITENMAILDYLVRQPGGAAFGPKQGDIADEIALVRWCSYLTGDVHPAFYPFFMPFRFTTDQSEDGLKAVKESAPKRVEFVFQVLENRLKGHKFILGAHKTIVDAYAFPMIRWLKTGMPDVYAKLPHIVKFYEAMSEDDGVKAALADQDIKA